MKATGCRRMLLAATSVLVLTAGAAMAQQGNGHGNGNGGNGSDSSGPGNGGGGGDGGGSDDSGGGGGGDDSGGGGDDDSGSGGGDTGGGAGDPGGGGLGSAPTPTSPSVDDASAPTGSEPAATETVAAPERDATFDAEDLVAAPAPLPDWSLGDFSGKRVQDPYGSGVGTVEGVVVDAQNNLYLVTALDSQDVDGHERVIPLSRFDLGASCESLVLGSETVAMLPQMADLAAVASAFMMVDSDEKLRSLLAAAR